MSVMASMSERETTPRENCSLTSVVASASEMQGTPKEKEKSSVPAKVWQLLSHVVLRGGRSFVEEGVEEERRLHLEEQLEREGEEEKEGKEEKLEEGRRKEGHHNKQ